VKSIRRGRFSVVTHKPEEIEEVVPLAEMGQPQPYGGGGQGYVMPGGSGLGGPENYYNVSEHGVYMDPSHLHHPTAGYYQGQQFHQYGGLQSSQQHPIHGGGGGGPMGGGGGYYGGGGGSQSSSFAAVQVWTLQETRILTIALSCCCCLSHLLYRFIIYRALPVDLLTCIIVDVYPFLEVKCTGIKSLCVSEQDLLAAAAAAASGPHGGDTMMSSSSDQGHRPSSALSSGVGGGGGGQVIIVNRRDETVF